MGDIKFFKQNNRLKRALPGQDHYGGLVFYSDFLPAGFSADDRIKPVYDTAAAEALGINDSHSDATAATGTITIGVAGTDGDVINVYAGIEDDDLIPKTLLATYTKVVGDNTVTLVATAIVALINAGTAVHGYSASNAAGVITITAPKKAGKYINGGTNLSRTLSAGATMTAVVVQFAGGVGSINAIMHYHIDEMFRINPDAVLWVGIYAVPVGAHTFSEVGLVRTKSNGTIRKMGVWTSKPYTTGDIALLQGIYNDSYAVFAMHEIFYSPNLSEVTVDNLPDYSASLSPNVHTIIAQDGAALGSRLYKSTDTISVGALGAAMGTITLAKVHENMGWVEKFNLALEGGELDVPALSNGTLISTLSNNITRADGTLDTKRLIFLKKFPAYTGSYFNDSHGCVAANSDYAYAEDNITIDKAIRGVYARMLPKVNGPVLTEPGTGKLRGEYVTYLQLEGGKALEEMENAGELSGYEVVVDPDQDVNSTGIIVMNISNAKIGVSRNFRINIGY